MKKKTVQYSIDEPCHESWAGMTPTEQGRFCNSCAKPVVDFTKMSDAQVLQFMSATTGSVCGRMTNYQLNRDFTHYEIAQSRSFSLRALVLGAALSTFSAVKTYAQGEIVGKVAATKGDVKVQVVDPAVVQTDSIPPMDTIFSGTVVDYLGGGYVGMVSVTIYDSDGDELSTTLTNESGEFRLPLDYRQRPFSAVFRKEEYEVQVFLFDEALTTRGITVEMNREMHIIMGLVAPVQPDPPAPEGQE